MDIKKALLLKPLLTISACLSHNNKRKPNLPYVENYGEVYRTLKTYGVYSDFIKKIHFLHLKRFGQTT